MAARRALVNPIPVSLCRALGAQIVIAVNLNTDIFGSSVPNTASELDATDEQAIVGWMRNVPGAATVRQLFSHRNDEPSILRVMTGSMTIIQDRISRSRLAGDPPDVIIAPELGEIGVLQFDRASESIAAGEAAVEHATRSLKAVLRRFGLDRP